MTEKTSRLLALHVEKRLGGSANGAGVHDGDSYVFLSLCDKRERARVYSGKSKSLDAALGQARGKALADVERNPALADWMKLDVVTGITEISRADFSSLLARQRRHFFRQGLAFDPGLDIAFLESEVNANALLDYKNRTWNNKNIRRHLGRRKTEFNGEHGKVYLFAADGYFCDEAGIAYPLHNAGYLYGSRIVDHSTAGPVEHVTHSAANSLKNLVDADGKYAYGFYPRFDKDIQAYNIIRHLGATWGLIEEYKRTGKSEFMPPIRRALGYVIREALVYRDAETAFILERPVNELKLGANALAILALVAYMEEFGGNEYGSIVAALGNGVLAMMDVDAGAYWHVLNYPDFSRKERFRIIYYDGEATFALARLHGFTKKAEYLAAAETALDNFIRNDYTRHADHWVSYSANEVTKYNPAPEYLDFGLKNANVNLSKIVNRDTTYHTYMEVLMAAFEIYDRIKTQNLECGYMRELAEREFLDGIERRARHMLQGYFYPEHAMYMKKPSRCLELFFVRHQDFRVRIDDVQHFMSGYQKYLDNYDKIQAYRKALR